MGNTDMEDVRYVVVEADGDPYHGFKARCEEMGIRVTDENGNQRPINDLLDEFWAALALRDQIRAERDSYAK